MGGANHREPKPQAKFHRRLRKGKIRFNMDSSFDVFGDYFGLSKLLRHEPHQSKTPPNSPAAVPGPSMPNLSLLLDSHNNDFLMTNGQNVHSQDLLSMENMRGDSFSQLDEEYDQVGSQSTQSDILTEQISGDDEVFLHHSCSSCSSVSDYSPENYVQLPFFGESPRWSSQQINGNLEDYHFPPKKELARGVSSITSGVDRLAQMFQEMNYTEENTEQTCFKEFPPVPRVRKEMHCVLCKRNGETREFYTTHVLKDSRGKVICPVLRKYECPRCLATGDNAHTLRHCPFADQGLGSMSRTFLTRRSSCGVRRSRDN